MPEGGSGEGEPTTLLSLEPATIWGTKPVGHELGSQCVWQALQTVKSNLLAPAGWAAACGPGTAAHSAACGRLLYAASAALRQAFLHY